MNLEERRVATQKTLDAFRGRIFEWGETNCAHLAHAHLVNCGHAPPEVPKFDTALGAARALRSLGFASMVELFDSMLERRPSVGFMRLGDIALVEGEAGLDAALICAGPLKVFGWREDRSELAVIDVNLDALTAAWSV